jgi:hypothetical protein
MKICPASRTRSMLRDKRSAVAVTGLQTAVNYWEFHSDENKIIIVRKKLDLQVVNKTGCH